MFYVFFVKLIFIYKPYNQIQIFCNLNFFLAIFDNCNQTLGRIPKGCLSMF